MALTKITPQMFDTSAAGHDFNIDNGTFVVDASANRVGIGTTTPSTLLDVNGVLTATSIAGTLTTAAQTNITSLGTLTSLTVDDITIDGSTISDAADFTIDAGGDIILDADGGDIKFKDGGTHIGTLGNSSNDLFLFPLVSDADFKIFGNDGGSTITALTLDMSAQGTARFNAGGTFDDVVVVDVGAPSSSDKTLSSFRAQSTREIGFVWDDSASTLGVATLTNHSLAFHTGGNSSERMRIDTSGRVLIGKTSTGLGNTGVEFESGQLKGTAVNQVVQYLNRTSSDGNIIDFRKNNSTIGVIGTQGGDLQLGTGAIGLRFKDASSTIQPQNMSTSSSTDNTIDLGGPSARFRNLYISGGIHVGGTGSANYLDDYEEGTLTVGNLAGYLNVSSVSNNYALYTKVGRLIHIQGKITVDPTATGRTAVSFTVPFAMHSGSNVGVLGHVTAYPNNTNNAMGIVIDYTGANNTQVYLETNVSSTIATGFTYAMTYATL